MHYTVTITNDMGHLMWTPATYPPAIRKFISSKILMYVDMATDTSNLGCRFYILKPGLASSYTYCPPNSPQDIVTIHYRLDTFHPATMRFI